MQFKNLILIATAAAAAVSCQQAAKESCSTDSGLCPAKFVAEYRNDSTELFTLRNANGMEACIKIGRAHV